MDIACKILIPQFLKSKHDGNALLELLLQHFPSYAPERYGSEEPLRKKFPGDNLTLVLEDWGHFCFTAERKKPSLWFNVWFAVAAVPDPGHTSVHLRLHSEDIDVASSMKGFVTAVSTVFGADLAVAHILTKMEFEERIEILSREPGSNPAHILQRARKVGTAEALDGMTTTQFKPDTVKRGLPDLCWLTLFGLPYVELFGRTRIISAPASEVCELENGSFVVTLTKTLADNRGEWDEFQAIRCACKQHLNTNAFIVSTATTRRYNAPKFRFPLEMYRPQSTS